MKSLFFLAVAAACVASVGCNVFVGTPGSGISATETRVVDEFHAIAASGSGDVNVTVGGDQSVSVTVDDNIIEMVRTETVNGTLKIWTEGSYSSSLGLKVDVTVPSLDGITVSGTSDVVASGVDSPKFSLSVSGTGDAKITGVTEDLDVSISGTGDADLRELISQTARVRTSGTGDAKIYASESVDAKASGTSDIEVYGNPTTVKKSESGVADIVLRN